MISCPPKGAVNRFLLFLLPIISLLYTLDYIFDARNVVRSAIKQNTARIIFLADLLDFQRFLLSKILYFVCLKNTRMQI